jgi:hypothetical protein
MKKTAAPTRRAELSSLVNGYRVTQALSVLVALRVPDQLVAGPRSADDLAAEVGAVAQPLYRLLRAVAALGVLEELPDRRFALTHLGQDLRSDVPGSLAGWTEFVGQRAHWTAWARLLDGIRTGEHPFRLEHGSDPWTYRRDHPGEAAVFSRAMNSLSTATAAAVVDSYDFSRFGTVVDVGAGGGALITAILAANPGVRGVHFDLPHVVADSRRYIDEAGLTDRCEMVGGSFFETLPEGGDAYVLKSVLHDWYDEDCGRILSACRAAMRPDAELLIVEQQLGKTNENPSAKFSDLNMLVAAGGMERTDEEWEALLAKNGFSLRRITPVGVINVFEAVPV